jgi:hypothetical protein
MTVYVDNARIPLLGRGRPMKMCHMVSCSSVAELFSMAVSGLGMNPVWFQCDKRPHFDISLTNRQRAIALGAIAVDSRILVRKARDYKEALMSNVREQEMLRSYGLKYCGVDPTVHLLRGRYFATGCK